MGAAMQLSDRIGRRMKLQDLHVLIAVVQAGSMGKAAERLSTTQPNVSRSIADLEHALGVRLLDRSRQGVQATQYGRALLDCGVAVFDELRQGMKNIEFLADPATGNVRIGCNPFLTASFVSTVVDRLSRCSPRIVIDVMVAAADVLQRELRERNVDFLIAWRFGPIADDRLEFKMLYDDAFVVVAGAKNPWVRRRKFQLADLVQESWVLPRPVTALGAVFAEAFRANGLDCPITTVFTNHAELRTNLVMTGRFLTIFSTSVLRFSTTRQELKILPIELPLARVPVGIVTLKNRTLSPVAQLLINCASEVARPMTKQRP